jgi:hypothetical protein
VNEQNRKLPYAEEVAVAWREQLAEAAENPWLAELLLKYGERILRRFTYFYEQLRMLSRRARRYIQRKLALKLSAAAFLLALSGMYVPAAYAAGINVDDGVAVADDGQCSLIEAILNANNDDQLYTSLGECAAGNGADIINLPPGGLFNLTGAYASSNNGLPVITSNITIEGNGSTIAGNNSDFRIFAVNPDGDLTLRDTTVTGGSIDGDGGGVFNYYGKVAILNNSVISGNYAYDSGGGVFNYGGEVTIENSLVSDNRADDDGGGVSNYDGALTINNSVISGNNAAGGGGVFNDDGVATIEHSTISSNAAYLGGGVANVDGGDLNIEGSTISGNTAFFGGGVGNSWSELTIENSAVSGNTAYFIGGGVDNWAGYVTINGSDILDNATYLGGGVCNNCWWEGIKDKATVQNSVLSGDAESHRASAVQQPYWYWGEVAIANSAVSGNDAQYGGGVANLYGLVTIGNSTVLGNDAHLSGGGVLNYSSYDPYVTKKSTISGNEASPLDSVYNYYYGAITVIENSTISGNDAQYGSGGGVANYVYVYDYSDRKNLAAGNAASSPEVVVNYYGGTVIIRDSTISGNEAHGDGGGVFNYVHYHYTEQTSRSAPQAPSSDLNFYYGAVVIENSIISGNEAGEEMGEGTPIYSGGRGGGVFNGHRYSYSTGLAKDASPLDLQQWWWGWGKVAIKDSAISDNDALYGGGMFNGWRWHYDDDGEEFGDSRVTIENSTISGNKAQVGWVYIPDSGYGYGGGAGGGLFNFYGAAVIDHSTISGNEADGSEFSGAYGGFVGAGGLFDAFVGGGGGVFNSFGEVDVLNDSTISGNIATGGYCYGDEDFDTHVINGGGGGLFNYYGLAFVTDSAISGNIVSGGYNDNDYEVYDLFVLTGGGGVLNAMRYSGGGRSAVSGTALSPLDVQNGEIHYWGEVVIENSAISGNVVSEGRYDYEDGYIYMLTGGGGLLNYTYYPEFRKSAVSGNDASPQESAQIPYAIATINQSTISGNIVAGAWYDGGAAHYNGGGGVANSGGWVKITDSTVSDNTAVLGGGVGNENGQVGINQSTISGNDAFFGGGVANNYGGVDLYHSTISDNTANRYGGGVASYDSLWVNLDHTIVSGNTAVRGREVFGSAYTQGYNLFGHDYDPGTVYFTPGTSDIVPEIDIRVRDILDPLADNGGPTETHALVRGSKAIDAGDPALIDPSDYDQRGAGFERVVNEVVDIGAYEYQAPAPVGGFTSPANGLEPLAPAMGLLAAIIALATSGVALVKRRRD